MYPAAFNKFAHQMQGLCLYLVTSSASTGFISKQKPGFVAFSAMAS